jgi:hypothetical protein
MKIYLQEGWYDQEDFIDATIAQKGINNAVEKLSKLFEKSQLETKRDDERFHGRLFIFSKDVCLLELDGHIVHMNKNIYDLLHKELEGSVADNHKDYYIKEIISNYIDVRDFMMFKTDLGQVEKHFNI